MKYISIKVPSCYAFRSGRLLQKYDKAGQNSGPKQQPKWKVALRVPQLFHLAWIERLCMQISCLWADLVQLSSQRVELRVREKERELDRERDAVIMTHMVLCVSLSLSLAVSCWLACMHFAVCCTPFVRVALPFLACFCLPQIVGCERLCGLCESSFSQKLA